MVNEQTTETAQGAAQFVKTDDGEFLVQVQDDSSQWGFYLADDDQTWDGGLGAATSWEVVDIKDVPEDVVDRLEYLLE